MDTSLSDQNALNTCSRLINSHRFGSPMLRRWYWADQRLSEISPLAASETFTEEEAENRCRIPAF